MASPERPVDSHRPGEADPLTPTDTVDPMVPDRHVGARAVSQYLGVSIDLRGVTTVMLPGTGSDDDYVTRAFAGPLRDAGARLVAPRPQPNRLIDGYLAGLDDAARGGPIAVGGVSIGAAVAVAWALRASRTHGRGAGRAARVDRCTRQLSRRARGTALRATAARRRSGRDDDADAGVQPAVVGRGADPVMAGPVAGSTRRHGRSGRLTSPRLTRSYSG